MAVKPINQLSARTPAAADVLAVADPFNGQTGKATVKQVNNTAFANYATAVQYVATGSKIPPSFILTFPRSFAVSPDFLT